MKTNLDSHEHKSKLSDESLVEGLRKKELSAFAEIVERYQSLVCAIAYAASGDRALSEDIAQEAFLALWQSPESIRNPGKLRSWLGGTARNKAKEHFRKRKPEVSSEDISSIGGGVSPAAELAARQENGAMEEALLSLPENYREPLVLYYREERSLSKVAELLEISLDVAKQRLSRGRKFLKEETEKRLEAHLVRTAPTTALVAAIIGLAAARSGVAEAHSGTGKSPATKGWTATYTALLGVFSVFMALTWWWSVSSAESGRSKAQSAVVTPKGAVPVQRRKSPVPAKVANAQHFRFEGLVVDSDDSPSPNAQIFLSGPQSVELRAGEDGTFAATALPEGIYTLRARQGPASSTMRQVMVAKDSEPVVVKLDNQMELVAHTLDEQGRALAGATIVFQGQSATTDAKGEARLQGLYPGMEQLQVEARGFATHLKHVVVPPGNGRIERRFRFQKPIALKIMVRDEAGRSQANARIVLKPVKSGSSFRVSRETGLDGSLEFPSLAAGHYELESSSADSRLFAKTDLNLQAESGDVSITLHPAKDEQPGKTRTVRGKVVDDEGYPVVGAVVRLRERYSFTKKPSLAVSGSDGSFQLDGVPAASIALNASLAGSSHAYDYLRAAAVEVLPSAKEVTLVVSRPGKLRAQIEMEEGGTPEQIWATISTFAAGARSFAPVIGIRNGELFLDNLPPGTYVLAISGERLSPLLVHEIEIKAGETTDLGSKKVTAGQELLGKVQRGDGQVASGALVVAGPRKLLNGAFESLEMMGSESLTKAGLHSTITDEDGEFRLYGAKAKDLAVVASLGENQSSPLVFGNTTRLTLQLSVGSTVLGKVTQKGTPAQARIKLKRGTRVIAEVETEGDGSYRFKALEPGEYELCVLPADSTSECINFSTVNLAEDEDTRFAIDLDAMPAPSLLIEVDFGKADMATVSVHQGHDASAPLVGFGSSAIDLATGKFSKKPIPFYGLKPGSYMACATSISSSSRGNAELGCKPVQVTEDKEVLLKFASPKSTK